MWSKKPHTEFKRKHKTDTVELESPQLAKQFNVVGDEGEGEAKESEGLIRKDWEEAEPVARREAGEAVWEGLCM